jgi:hypothetical protein
VANVDPAQGHPLGQPRGVVFGILMYIVTFHLYSWYWAYKTCEELKQYNGDGIGGVIGLIVEILLWPINAFVIPDEIGKMYERDGQEKPVSAITGLWGFPGIFLIVPAIVWFVKVQGALNRFWEAKRAPPAMTAGG